jgi:DNA repair protein RadC
VLLALALCIAEQRLTYYGAHLTHPQLVRDYLTLWAAGRTEEGFGVIWLTSQHQVIAVRREAEARLLAGHRPRTDPVR